VTIDATPMSYVTPVCCSFCRKIAADNARLRRWLTTEVGDRLVEFLAGLAMERNGELVILRPPTHPNIAKAIGTTRETVNRELAKLKLAGHVTARQRCGSTTRITVSRELVEMAARVVMNGSAS
jgi:hypothetical protein